ncbi:MAG TPA: endopeptidase La, partial [Phaeodactylibacter sp.]|nr:endopeptidase La [Phaeodactylibacter sp.]
MKMFEDIFRFSIKDSEPEFMPMFSFEAEIDAEPAEGFPDVLPVLALKNTVLFPGVITPITVGRDKSIKAIHQAYEGNRLIAVLAQKDDSIENPEASNLYEVGVIASVVKLLRMPDGTTTAILHGRRRGQLKKVLSDDPYLLAEVEVLKKEEVTDPLSFDAIVASIRDMAKQIIALSPQIPSDANIMLSNIENKPFLIHFIASNLTADVSIKQKILEEDNLNLKAEAVMKQMDEELKLLEIRDQIENKVRGSIEKQQRD